MKKGFFMGIMAAIGVLFGCQAENNGYKSVSVQEFAHCIADTANVIRLDVRTAEEYAAGHIENAINIDVLQDDFETKATSSLPKEKTIALYCRSGKRSKKAAEILVNNGYTVLELSTGFNGWNAK